MAIWPFNRKKQKLITTSSTTREVAKAVRSDAWKNIFTKLGKSSRDKRTGGRFEIEIVTSQEAAELWAGDSLMAKVIEKLPKAAMRKGYKVKVGDQEKSEKVHAAIEASKVNRDFVRALCFERAYGGAALYPVINDGQDLSQPLDEGSIFLPEHFLLFEPRELTPILLYTDPTEKHYGKTKLWRVNPIATAGLAGETQYIHDTRLIIFPGIVTTRGQSVGVEYMGWGANLPTRVFEKLRDLNLSWGAAAALVQDFAQAVIKLAGLAKLIEDDEDDEVIERLLQMDISRSILRAIVIDKDDEFTREQTPMAGLVDLLVQFMSWFAAASDMPVTKLFGISPAGLNATGESDLTMWDDSCEELQDEHMPQLEQLVQLFLLAQDGPLKGREPEMWSVEFNPLRTPSPSDEATRRKTIAETDAILIDSQMISPEEATSSHYGGDTFNPEIVIDWKARKAQELAADPVVKPEPEVPIDPLTGLPMAPQPELEPGEDPAKPPAGGKNGAPKPMAKPAPAR